MRCYDYQIIKKAIEDELTESELDNLGSQGYVLVGVVPLVEADTDDRGYRAVEKYNQLIFARETEL